MTPGELLSDLESSLDQLSPDVSRWLASALRRYKAGIPLEQGLCLSGNPARRYRDESLRRAASLLGETPWQAAESLRMMLSRLPVVENPPDDPLRLEIWRIRNCGLPVPTSRRSIYRILVTDNGNDVLSVTLSDTCSQTREKNL